MQPNVLSVWIRCLLRISIPFDTKNSSEGRTDNLRYMLSDMQFSSVLLHCKCFAFVTTGRVRYEKLQKIAVSFTMSITPSICLSVRI
jgi:hypothetical protein